MAGEPTHSISLSIVPSGVVARVHDDEGKYVELEFDNEDELREATVGDLLKNIEE